MADQASLQTFLTKKNSNTEHKKMFQASYKDIYKQLSHMHSVDNRPFK